MSDEILFFAYGSLLPGEMHHAHIVNCKHVGAGRTADQYRLVDLGQFPALISGDRVVAGELYLISRGDRFRLDSLKENGRVFERGTVVLSDGRTAEAYFMDPDKLRGRRRLTCEDWRQRFAAPVSNRRGSFTGR